MKGDIPQAAFKILQSGVPVRTHCREFTDSAWFDTRAYMRNYRKRQQRKPKRGARA